MYIIQPFTGLQCHFIAHNVRRVCVYLYPATCHFRQNERELLRATAVTRGWNGYRNKSQYRKLTGGENSPAAPAGTQTGDLSITGPALYQVAIAAPHNKKRKKKKKKEAEEEEEEKEEEKQQQQKQKVVQIFRFNRVRFSSRLLKA